MSTVDCDPFGESCVDEILSQQLTSSMTGARMC